MHEGSVVALCTSSEGGVPKYPQKSVTVAQFGFEGDYHCRPMRRSFSKPGELKPNTDRHLTIVAEEDLVYANDYLDICLMQGHLAENIFVRGIGSLAHIAPGSLVRLGEGKVVLSVVEQNNPCKNLRAYHRLLPKVIHGRRGLLCAVVEGIGTVLTPGGKIIIEPPA